MRKSFLAGSLLGCLAASTPLPAQETLITVGKYQAHPTRILAKYANQVALQTAGPTLQNLGLTVQRRYTLVPGLVVLDENLGPIQRAQVLSAEARARRLLDRLVALRDSGLFEYVSPDYAVFPALVPTDARFADGTLWGLQNTGQNGGEPGADVGAVPAWDLTTGSTNVIVAVIDTGINYNHSELINQMWKNPKEVPLNGLDDDGNGFVDDVFGINAIVDSGNPLDDDDHGTHVSGTIGAAANDGNPHVGVTWNVRLMGCKFIRSGTQGGFGLNSDAIQCIQYAVANGAKILNNSWGGGGFTSALRDAILAAHTNDVLFVAAAGNAANNNDTLPFYPATYQVANVISVAAIDRLDRLAIFSNFGSNTVHIGAPGVSIFSSTSGSETEYKTFQGTSMAAPHVSGVAALILARYTNSTVLETRERLIVSAVKTTELRRRTSTGGRVNAFNALLADADGVLEISVEPPSESSILSGSTAPIFVTVRDLFPVTNAMVRGMVVDADNNTVTNLTFANDGMPPDVVTNDHIYSVALEVPTNTTQLTLTVIASAPDKTNATNTVIYHVVFPPPNDKFTNALKFPSGGGQVLGTNRFASVEFREPLHAGVPSMGASVWWNWSPPENTPVIIDTAGSEFDTVLAVYTGSQLSNLREVASVDDIPLRKQGYVTFDAIAGTTYRIAVAGFDTNEVGLIRLRVEPRGQPDTNAPIVTVTSPLSGQVVTNRLLFITGTAYDPQPNASGVNQIFVRVNNQLATSAEGTTNWSSSAFLDEGANLLQVFGVDFADNRSDPIIITVFYRAIDPPNDVFANALELTGTSGTVSGDNTRANKEFGEPLHGGNEGGKSIWWHWTAPADGVLELSTTNSTFDTLLGLYVGTRVRELTTVASNDDAIAGVTHSRIVQAVRGGLVYRIAVDGFAGASGSVQLTFNFQTARVFNFNVTHTTGGIVRPASGTIAEGATLVVTALPDANFEFVGWEGSATSSANPLSIVASSDINLHARFAPRAFTDDFETGDFRKLPWVTSGNVPWRVQSDVVSVGRFAAASGAIGDNQSSSLLLVTNMAAGTAAFDLRVSSEGGWDFLEFYLNGVRLQRWSGEINWFTFEFAVPTGTNRLEWIYRKDANKSLGLDGAFIDNLDLPLTSSPGGGETPLRLSVTRQPDGSAQVLISGTPNQQYLIWASSNLIDWQTIASVTLGADGTLTYIDPNRSTLPHRFYRATR